MRFRILPRTPRLNTPSRARHFQFKSQSQTSRGFFFLLLFLPYLFVLFLLFLILSLSPPGSFPSASKASRGGYKQKQKQKKKKTKQKKSKENVWGPVKFSTCTTLDGSDPSFIYKNRATRKGGIYQSLLSLILQLFLTGPGFSLAPFA